MKPVTLTDDEAEALRRVTLGWGRRGDKIALLNALDRERGADWLDAPNRVDTTPEPDTTNSK